LIVSIRKLSLEITVFFFIVSFSVVEARDINRELHHYIETRGTDSQEVRWDLSHGNGFRLVYQKASETHVTETNETLVTLVWSMQDHLNQCDLEARRENNTIFIKGRYLGQSVDKQIKVDDAPWFQATSLSLRRFVMSQQKEIQFWSLRPDTQKGYKLKAVKVDREVLTILGEPVEAVKIKLSLLGWKASFWKSHCWYSTSDGLFVRFEGPANAAGTKRIMIEYTGKNVGMGLSCL